MICNKHTLYFLIMMMVTQIGLSCTGIIIRTEGGTTVAARTMEFGFNVRSKILVIPKGTSLRFLSSNPNKEGYKMQTKYGFAGMNAVEKNIVVDGINEAGLYLGCFYFHGFAVYDSLTAKNRSQAISSEEMGNFILGSFSTVDEVIEGLKDVTVVGTFIQEIQGEAPFHYAVTDQTGRSIVIEFTKEGLQIHENTVGVVCNNPTYDWHLTNLRNYVNLSPNNTKGFSIKGESYTPLGEGTGMLGLPGDYTSPSRFVRAAAFVSTVLPSQSEEDGVFRAFHVLNAFDIPKGAVRQKMNNQMLTDYTVWTSVVDTKNKFYYFKTYENQTPIKVDLKEILQQANGELLLVDSETPRSYSSLQVK